MADNSSHDIFVLISKAPPPAPLAVAQPAAPKRPRTLWERVLSRTYWLSLETIAPLVWTSVCLQLFVFDIDRVLLSAIGAPAWLLGYKFLVWPALLAVAAMLFWGWAAFGACLYIVFYPPIVLLWKCPKFFVQRRWYNSLPASIFLLNALAVLIKNFRYHAISKGLGLLATVAVLWSRNRILLILASLLLVGLFLWALARVVFETFRSSFFVDAQRRLIRLVSRFTDAGIKIDASIAKAESITTEQRTAIVNEMQRAIFVNRALYLWSYKLHQYRKSNLGVVLNGGAYLGIFFGAAIVMFLLNYALLKIDVSQYQFDTYPSVVAMALYGLSTLAFSEGGRVSAAGDLAYGLRIVAGLFGPAFMLT